MSFPSGRMIPARSWCAAPRAAGIGGRKPGHLIEQDEADRNRIGKAFFHTKTQSHRRPCAGRGPFGSQHESITIVAPAQAGAPSGVRYKSVKQAPACAGATAFLTTPKLRAPCIARALPTSSAIKTRDNWDVCFRPHCGHSAVHLLVADSDPRDLVLLLEKARLRSVAYQQLVRCEPSYLSPRTAPSPRSGGPMVVICPEGIAATGRLLTLRNHGNLCREASSSATIPLEHDGAVQPVGSIGSANPGVRASVRASTAHKHC